MAKQSIKLGTAPGGTDGDTTRAAFNKCNINFDELYTRAQSKLVKDIAGGAGSVSLSAAEALAGIIDLTGNITGNREVLVPAEPVQTWIVRNSTAGNFAVTFRTAGGTGVTIAQGATDTVFSDGVNVVSALGAVMAAAAAAQTAASTAQAQVTALLSGMLAKVEYFARNTPPTGYLKANGAAVSRITYAALFAVIGTVFGTGDGSTTFNLPDLRGEFIRGWDDGRGVDAGRAFGGFQAMDLQSHLHFIQNFIPTGSFAQTGNAVTLGQSVGNNYPTTSAGGAETRPRNVALLACIKH